MLETEIAALIKTLMGIRKMSQADLAKKAQVSKAMAMRRSKLTLTSLPKAKPSCNEWKSTH
jgi:hypothetical protein